MPSGVERKYAFTGRTKEGLRQIRALKAFAGVAAGEVGGWIESEDNLSHLGDAWVGGDAEARDRALIDGNARVHGKAKVLGRAQIIDDAQVFDEACVLDTAQVFGEAMVFGKARVFGEAHICGEARVSRPILAASRSDGELFVCCEQRSGPPIVSARFEFQCLTFAEARRYMLEEGETGKREETFLILDFLEKAAALRGFRL